MAESTLLPPADFAAAQDAKKPLGVVSFCQFAWLWGLGKVDVHRSMVSKCFGHVCLDSYQLSSVRQMPSYCSIRTARKTDPLRLDVGQTCPTSMSTSTGRSLNL